MCRNLAADGSLTQDQHDLIGTVENKSASGYRGVFQKPNGRYEARATVGGKKTSFDTYLAVELAALKVAAIEQEIADEEAAARRQLAVSY